MDFLSQGAYPYERRRKPRQINNVIHRRCFKRRTRHGHCLCRFWILHNGQSTASFDRFKPLRPVGIGAREHDADQRLCKHIRRTLELEIESACSLPSKVKTFPAAT
jgi:hypothetical protein